MKEILFSSKTSKIIQLPLNRRGFTLIELMVVVTIIAFLSVIGMAAFTNVQAQARDGRRRADIDAIATAMETNRSGAPGSEKYPAYDEAIFANNQKPYDPLDTDKDGLAESYGSGSYEYKVTPGTASADSFVACATLEKGNGNSSSNTSISTSGNLIYYCRAAQQ